MGQLELEMYPRLVLVPLIGESPLIRDVNSAPAKTGLSSNNFPASLLHVNLFAIEIISQKRKNPRSRFAVLLSSISHLSQIIGSFKHFAITICSVFVLIFRNVHFKDSNI